MTGFRVQALSTLALALVTLSCSSGGGQTSGLVSLTGRITDADTGEPLKNVVVGEFRKGIRVLTDENGRYALDSLEPKELSLSLYRFGYAPARREIIRTFGEPADQNRQGSNWRQDFSLNPEDRSGRPQDSAYLVGYDRGRVVADGDLRSEDACLYEGRNYSEAARITGLPVRAPQGMLYDSRTQGFVEGHNDRILRYVAEVGLPPVHRLAKYRDYNHLNYIYYRHRNRPGDHWLQFNGLSASSPDSLINLRLIVPDPGWPRYFLEIRRPDTVIYVEMAMTESDSVHVSWPPSEDEAVVLRTSRYAFCLVDLRSGECTLFARYDRGWGPEAGR